MAERRTLASEPEKRHRHHNPMHEDDTSANTMGYPLGVGDRIAFGGSASVYVVTGQGTDGTYTIRKERWYQKIARILHNFWVRRTN